MGGVMWLGQTQIYYSCGHIVIVRRLAYGDGEIVVANSCARCQRRDQEARDFTGHVVALTSAVLAGRQPEDSLHGDRAVLAAQRFLEDIYIASSKEFEGTDFPSHSEKLIQTGARE